MLTDDVQLVSVDDHVIEHKDVWQDRLPAALKERGPRVVRQDDGREVWVYDGKVFPQIGLNAVAGKDQHDFNLEPITFSDMIPGCYEVGARVKDMDLDGVQAQLCFPSLPGFAGGNFFEAEDKDLALLCVKAWNDFMIDEWCAAAPDRFIPMIITPFWDVQETKAEIERCAEKGAKAITFTESPLRYGLPTFHSDHWDPAFAAAEAAQMPLCMHFGSGGAPVTSPDAPFMVAIALFGTNSMFTTVELLMSRLFTKFPGLKVALSEGGIGWMPYILERVDYTWERHRWYQEVDRTTKPSELFAEHIYGCFISDFAGIGDRHLIGVDNIMWEGDYPHSDSQWPNSRKVLSEALVDVPDHEARKIAEDNARRLFNFPRR
jgi:predicted TIM-barrel fold metal-dependent hydrolase